jgi:hypothetical protein
MWRLDGIFARVREGVNTGNNKGKPAVSQDEGIAKWKETVMKVTHKAIASQHIRNTLLAFFATAAPASEQPATVVAHMPLSGYPTSQTDVRENGGKQYLYIGANPHEGLTVVDLTNPDQPNVIKRLAWPNEASTGRLQLVSGGLALAEGARQRSGASRSCSADLDPKGARLEQSRKSSGHFKFFRGHGHSRRRSTQPRLHH